MNTRLCILLFTLLSVCGVSSQSRQSFSINNDWTFHKGDLNVIENGGVQGISWGNIEEWETVNLPHTWNNLDAIDDEAGYYRGVGWYKKTIFIEEEGQHTKTLIYFEGANQVADLYVNGSWVGQHKGGYTRFHFDITPFLKIGQDNVFAIKVDNSHNTDIPPLSADFTFFGGIYRDVFLIKMNDVHFSMDDFSSSGIYITTPSVTEEKAKVEVRSLLSNGTDRNITVDVSHRIVDREGNTVLENNQRKKLAKSHKSISVSQEMIIGTPNLWSPQNPYLYNIISRIKDAKTGRVLDESIQPLGLRWFEFDPKKGFFLNGKYLKLIGTNRHQDYKEKGNALLDEMHVRDIRLLKDMGGNFLRISHYPQDPTVLEMCDRLGIITSVEIPIVNAITESEEFTKNSLFMAEEMVKQNFNHPSLIIWAYMNEVLLRLPYNQKTEKERYRTYADNVTELASEIELHIRELDPSRYTMIPNHGAISRYKDAGLTEVPMILGWNLYQGWYSGKLSAFDENLDELHSLFPDQPIIITEYGADVHPRLHSFNPERFDYTVEYGNMYHEHYLKGIMERPYIVGANIWNLNDFYSESRGYAFPRANLKGITTLDREKKDTWWLYKTFLSKEPIVKFGQNQWTIRGGVAEAGKNFCRQPLTVYSNGESVELSHNDTEYNAKVVDHIARFSVPFVNGRNKFVAKSTIGSKVYTDVLEVDFRLAPNKFLDFNEDFYSLNILLGTQRMYEDKVKDIVWIPEQEYTMGSWGYVGGQPFRPKTKYGSLPSSDLDILDSENDPIYQTQRVGIKKFKFDVPEGKYTVSLGWAELQSDIEHEKLVYNLGNDKVSEVVSDRIFNVLINGAYVEKNLNPTERFEAEKAVMKKYTVLVTGKEGIQIDFEAIKGNPILNTIQIRKRS
ncbi:glycoside hydrolase family 2 TIM barrel-domain containing protein [Maribacter polysaccharolyticus]|uniref:glycoside hydrolase family 2 TIM barrel-domain containing protein n=1 Tax=Maribacter polysaccharolyticus TaxID=3020831 RepID=UPI00237EFFD2|nr:glycoside hydrolase family 2 TIM barrel-domain containing protein [Maribacter polysaccharolyticus]MDE3740916.1 glycoside hydrolase family 2 TIM barrel-domain containing protein [Maribacter polysaccharolyticus]